MKLETQKKIMFIPIAHIIIPFAWYAHIRKREKTVLHGAKCLFLLLLIAPVFWILFFLSSKIPNTAICIIVNLGLGYLWFVIMDAIFIIDQAKAEKTNNERLEKQ